jgi:hypothetical protein
MTGTKIITRINASESAEDVSRRERRRAMGSRNLETGERAETDEKESVMAYQDAVLAMNEELCRRGARPSAILEACDRVTVQKAEGLWIQVNGEAINENNQNVEEYCEALINTKPHYLYMGEELDRAVAAWVGLDGKPYWTIVVARCANFSAS